MATAMLDNGANITAIQEILGHALLSSTQTYTHVSKGKLREVYAKTHPDLPQGNPQPAASSTKALYKWGGQPFSKKTTRKTFEFPDNPLGRQVALYLRAMAEQKDSAGTIRKRRQHLRRFLLWCEQRDLVTAQEITHTLLERYHKDLYRRRHEDKPLNPSYIARHLISLHCFFAHLAAIGTIPHNVAQKVKLPRRLKTIPYQILSQEEIEKIFAQVDTTDPLGVRDRAILALLWATGIRNRELCSLSAANVNLQRKTLTVGSKTDSSRIVPIADSALTSLSSYLLYVRPRLVRNEGTTSLFLGRYGSPLSPITLAAILKRYFQKAAVAKPASCRIFRHTLASTMLENGADIRHIQEFLGHKNLTSTQIYTKISIRRLKEVHAQTHPASTLKGKPKTTSEANTGDPGSSS